jgi:RHS repeat-associated protein
VTETENDSLGNTVTFVTRNGYDNLDRLIWTRDNLGNYAYYSYDSRNNNKWTKDRENNVTRRNYDELNRLREVLYELTTTKNISVKYSIDKNGRLVAMTDDNTNTTQYRYDDVNRRSREILPDNSQKIYNFGQYGVLNSMTDPNWNIINYTYDDALRLNRKDVTKATDVKGTTFEIFGYDGLSRMLSAQNDFSTITMNYDSLGNLLNETQQIGSQSAKSVASAYNELGFRTSLTYPNGRQINFTPDVLNRIDLIREGSNIIADYDYVGPARVKSRKYQSASANPIILTVGHDDNRRGTSYNYTGTKVYTATEEKKGKPKKYEWLPTPIGFEYSHDKEGNKFYEKRTPEGKGDAYIYDAIYRLTGVQYGVPNLDPLTTYDNYLTCASKEEFDLDGVGNREQVRTQNAELITQNYSVNELNQYTAIDGLAPRYDLNGNMTFDGMNNIGYDYANRPVRFENTVYIVEVTYDALGRRLQEKVITKATGEIKIEGYILDGNRVLSDLDESGNPAKDYIWGNGIDELLATAKGRSTNYYFYLHNSLGSVTHIVNKDAEVEESYKYTIYGVVTIYDRKGEEAKKSKSNNRYLFTGREYDSETGLYYYRARYYSPELGRFISVDPNEHDDYLSLYGYVKNNPINYTDSLGTYPNRDTALATARGRLGVPEGTTKQNPDGSTVVWELVDDYPIYSEEFFSTSKSGEWEPYGENHLIRHGEDLYRRYEGWSFWYAWVKYQKATPPPPLPPLPTPEEYKGKYPKEYEEEYKRIMEEYERQKRRAESGEIERIVSPQYLWFNVDIWDYSNPIYLTKAWYEIDCAWGIVMAPDNEIVRPTAKHMASHTGEIMLATTLDTAPRISFVKKKGQSHLVYKY